MLFISPSGNEMYVSLKSMTRNQYWTTTRSLPFPLSLDASLGRERDAITDVLLGSNEGINMFGTAGEDPGAWQ
jgi:hypothetical protein